MVERLRIRYASNLLKHLLNRYSAIQEIAILDDEVKDFAIVVLYD